MAQQRKILIILLGAIGDVTRALPLAMRIKRSWPDVHLTWAVEPKSYPVIKNHQAIDEVVVFHRHKGFLAYCSFAFELRSKKFDIVLDLQRHFKSGVTSFCTGAKRRIGFSRNNAKEFNWIFNNEHITAVENFSPKIFHYQEFGNVLNLELLEPLEFGLSPSKSQILDVEMRLSTKMKELVLADAKQCRRVALIVGSSWPSRLWMAEHYREFILAAHSKFGFVSVIVGAESERVFVEEILSERIDLPAINMVNQLKLDELPALFSSVSIALGSDSGPMHIAAAVGIPVVSLWGSTSSMRSAPYGSEAFVIKSVVPCSPCYKRECPGLGMRCMLELSPAMVLARFHAALEHWNTQ